MEQLQPLDCSDEVHSQHSAERRLSIVTEEESAGRRHFEPSQRSSPDVDAHPAAKRQRIGYTCPPCNMNFTEKRALARHRKTDHHRRQIGLPPDRRHACNRCGKYFTRGHDLKRHQNEQHPDHVTSAVELSSGESEYGAGVCSWEESPQSYASMDTKILSPTIADVLLPAHGESSPLNISVQSSPHFERLYGHEQIHHMTPIGNDETVLRRQIMPPVVKILAPSSLPDLIKTESTDSSEGSPDSYRIQTSHGNDTIMSSHESSLPYAKATIQARSMDPGHTNRNLVEDIHVKRTALQPFICVICGIAYEHDPAELVGHLRRHLDTSRGAHRCTDCQIGFVHEEDLERHLQCAAKGHCGFSFPHSQPCSGHHPPTNGSEITGLSDNDRIRLSDRLQHWEQAQLQAHISEINQLHAELRDRRPARWSEVLPGGSRRNSQSSFAVSVKTYASAPCDGEVGKMDVGGLQKRMQQMSLGNANTRIRRLMRTGTVNSPDIVNKALRKAVKQAQLPKVTQHLEAGGDPSIVFESDEFVTVALWGQGYVAERMVQHRIDEDMMGRCSKCGMNSTAFADNPDSKIRALLRHKAEVDRQGGLCDYPLITAAWLGRVNIVKMLLERGARMDQASSRYGTALCAAASNSGRSETLPVVRLLLEHGADPLQKTLGETARALARRILDSLMTQSAEVEGSNDDNSGRLSNCQAVVLALERAEFLSVKGTIPEDSTTRRAIYTPTSDR